jgi:uncharacterized alkaline shock family protein YloU
VEGHASISTDVLARYAADAAREVEGVRGLVDSALHRHRGVRVNGADPLAGVTVELHVDVAWGVSIPAVGEEVQRRVRDYLERMAGARPLAVNVVVDEIGPPE